MVEKKSNAQARKSSAKKNGKGAMKKSSRRAMMFATIWIIIATILKDLFKFDFPMSDILTVAVSIVAIWTPGYISIWIDKVMAGHIETQKLRGVDK